MNKKAVCVNVLRGSISKTILFKPFQGSSERYCDQPSLLSEAWVGDMMQMHALILLKEP